MYLYIFRIIIKLYKNTKVIPLQFQNHYLSNKKHCMQIAIHCSQNVLKSY